MVDTLLDLLTLRTEEPRIEAQAKLKGQTPMIGSTSSLEWVRRHLLRAVAYARPSNAPGQELNADESRLV